MMNNLRIGRWQAGEMLTPQLKPLVREILLSILDAPVLKEISALAAMEMEITSTQLERLNCVQKWFNVQYLSKLCDKEGTMI